MNYLTIMLLILFGLVVYGIGLSHGAELRKKILGEFRREVKRNINADKFSNEVLYGEGAEPDDFEVAKTEKPIQGEGYPW